MERQLVINALAFIKTANLHKTGWGHRIQSTQAVVRGDTGWGHRIQSTQAVVRGDTGWGHRIQSTQAVVRGDTGWGHRIQSTQAVLRGDTGWGHRIQSTQAVVRGDAESVIWYLGCPDYILKDGFGQFNDRSGQSYKGWGKLPNSSLKRRDKGG
jgi:hypothetical protein